VRAGWVSLSPVLAMPEPQAISAPDKVAIVLAVGVGPLPTLSLPPRPLPPPPPRPQTSPRASPRVWQSAAQVGQDVR
jgi:hypothetical protein